MSQAVDISAELGPVRDQGRRGTCLAFATSAAHEVSRLRRRGGPRSDLGEELLYWRCKKIDADGTDGTTPKSVATALLDPGQSAAVLWPYDNQRDERASTYEPPASALEAGVMRHGTLISAGKSANDIAIVLESGHAVVLAIDLWPQFFADHHGELAIPERSELLGAPHAITVVGFERAEKALLIRNSWGSSWGEEGHARLPEEALEVAALGAWIVQDDVDH